MQCEYRSHSYHEFSHVLLKGRSNILLDASPRWPWSPVPDVAERLCRGATSDTLDERAVALGITLGPHRDMRDCAFCAADMSVPEQMLTTDACEQPEATVNSMRVRLRLSDLRLSVRTQSGPRAVIDGMGLCRECVFPDHLQLRPMRSGLAYSFLNDIVIRLLPDSLCCKWMTHPRSTSSSAGWGGWILLTHQVLASRLHPSTLRSKSYQSQPDGLPQRASPLQPDISPSSHTLALHSKSISPPETPSTIMARNRRHDERATSFG